MPRRIFKRNEHLNKEYYKTDSESLQIYINQLANALETENAKDMRDAVDLISSILKY